MKTYKTFFRVLGCLSAVLLLLIISFLWLLRKELGPDIQRQETAVKDLPPLLDHIDPAIRVLGSFECSSYSKWNGDGGTVVVYLIDPSDIDAFVTGLRRSHEHQRIQFPDAWKYEWSEAPRPHLCGFEGSFPRKYRAPKDTYLVGKWGNLSLSIGKTTGFIAFGSEMF